MFKLVLYQNVPNAMSNIAVYDYGTNAPICTKKPSLYVSVKIHSFFMPICTKDQISMNRTRLRLNAKISMLPNAMIEFPNCGFIPDQLLLLEGPMLFPKPSFDELIVFFVVLYWKTTFPPRKDKDCTPCLLTTDMLVWTMTGPVLGAIRVGTGLVDELIGMDLVVKCEIRCFIPGHGIAYFVCFNRQPTKY